MPIVIVPSRWLLVIVDGRLRERAIETGLKSWAFVEVVKGLSEGEQVVVSRDKPDIKAGARVRVTQWSGAANPAGSRMKAPKPPFA